MLPCATLSAVVSTDAEPAQGKPLILNTGNDAILNNYY